MRESSLLALMIPLPSLWFFLNKFHLRWAFAETSQLNENYSLKSYSFKLKLQETYTVKKLISHLFGNHLLLLSFILDLGHRHSKDMHLTFDIGKVFSKLVFSTFHFKGKKIGDSGIQIQDNWNTVLKFRTVLQMLKENAKIKNWGTRD